MILSHPKQADILALDADDNPVMIIEVKARRSIDESDKQQIIAYLGTATKPMPFAMFVDRDRIRIYEWNGQELSAPLMEIATAAVLTHYEPEFTSKEIFESYMNALVEGWLRDVAYHWKSENPPGFDQLTAAGIAQRLQNGTTVSQAQHAA